jgi:hypothetical protein
MSSIEYEINKDPDLTPHAIDWNNTNLRYGFN